MTPLSCSGFASLGVAEEQPQRAAGRQEGTRTRRLVSRKRANMCQVAPPPSEDARPRASAPLPRVPAQNDEKADPQPTTGPLLAWDSRSSVSMAAAASAANSASSCDGSYWFQRPELVSLSTSNDSCSHNSSDHGLCLTQKATSGEAAPISRHHAAR